MARPTKIRQAKSAEEYRDAVVERWKEISKGTPKARPPENPDAPPPPPRQPRRMYPGGRVFEDLPPRHGFGRGDFNDDDD